ncbi:MULTISPECIES: hypothetical protein [Catenuloplanes]|uniref:Uncharacterized protein n=1 Tax=Catenuloplanes niger TaxID=587534 RepID=A0AAE3ZWP4_9ACTN|nr:hypothetical protein [Catenuloplanes niger]MDR7327408.1 hypothetical protein [Catenuloplanes niger]
MDNGTGATRRNIPARTPISLAAILVGVIVLVTTAPDVLRGEVAILPVFAVVAALAAIAVGVAGLIGAARHP